MVVAVGVAVVVEKKMIEIAGFSSIFLRSLLTLVVVVPVVLFAVVAERVLLFLS